LLKKCLHGLTQNNNESLNGVIWKRCSKDIYVSKRSLELSLNSAIISFNDGCLEVLKVFEVLGVSTGRFMNHASKLHDALRISKGNHKSTNKCKIRRQKLRGIKKGFLDKEAEEETVPFYESGAF